MDRLSCADLAAATGGELRQVDPSAEITGNAIDSRKVSPADVFWAFPGEHTDGHRFAGDAVARGARLVVCRRDQADHVNHPRLMVLDPLIALQQFAAWYRARQPGMVIGVTGSVGKTTTRGLIHAVLSAQFDGVQSPASFNNHLGVPLSLLEMEQHYEFAVLEMGASRQGEIRELAAIARPEVGVITAIGRAHLEGFGSVDGIVRAKGELLESLPPTGFAVLPGDDPVTRAMATRARCRTLFVGESRDNSVRASDVSVERGGLSFLVDGDRFTVPVMGRHHLSNALIAVAIAREIGITPELIQAGFAQYSPSPGRGQVLTIGPWHVVDDTYNASPTSMAAALELLANLPLSTRGRRFAVLGDMLELGDATESEHFALGQLAGALRLDGVLACGAAAMHVARGALNVGLPAGRIVASSQLEVLLAVLDCWLEPGDVVLVKGSRGMRMERVLDWMRQQAGVTTCKSVLNCA